MDGIAKGQGILSNIINPDVKYLGVGIGNHPNGLVIVVTFATELHAKESPQKQEIKPKMQ